MLSAFFLRPLALLSLLLLVPACATQGPVLDANVTALRASVASVDSESEKIFADLNGKARDDVIRLLLANREMPTEKAFAPLIDGETMGRWSAAFAGVDEYLAGLQDLVDAGPSTAIGGDLTAIGNTLQSESFGVTLPAGASGLFGKLGASIVQASAEKKAQAVMQKVDPAFNALMAGLGDLVGEASGPSKPGTLRAMADDYWFNQIAAVEKQYRPLLNGTVEQRQPVLTDYGRTLDLREADRQRLGKLRAALRAVGEAHSEAAKGSAGGMLFWLSQINDALKEARDAAKQEK